MMLIEEKRSTRRKVCPICSLSIKSGLGLKLCPRSGRTATNSRSHGNFMAQIFARFILELLHYLVENKWFLIYQVQSVILCRKKKSVYCEQHTECITTLLQSLLMLKGGTYDYHFPLNFKAI